MADETHEALGPVEWVVVEFAAGSTRFAGEAAAELARLVESELIRIIDLLIIDKTATGGVSVVEFEESGDSSELRVLEGRLAEVLAAEDVENVARAMTPGTTVGVLVWENTWAAPFGAAARDSGGQLVDGGPIPNEALISAVAADVRAGSSTSMRRGRASKRGVITRTVVRTSALVGTTADLARGVTQRQTAATTGGRTAGICDPSHREPKERHPHGR